MMFLTKAGMVLLSVGGLSGMLLYVAIDKPKGWLGIRQVSRLRQGHVDALIIGTILLALGALVALPAWIGVILTVSGYYTSFATGSLAWWPDWSTKGRLVWWADFASLSSFAIGLCLAATTVLMV